MGGMDGVGGRGGESCGRGDDGGGEGLKVVDELEVVEKVDVVEEVKVVKEIVVEFELDVNVVKEVDEGDGGEERRRGENREEFVLEVVNKMLVENSQVEELEVKEVEMMVEVLESVKVVKVVAEKAVQLLTTSPARAHHTQGAGLRNQKMARGALRAGSVVRSVGR